MKKYLASLFLTTQIFAFAGIGAYGNLDMFSVTPPSTSNNIIPEVTVTPESLDNAAGIGEHPDVMAAIESEINAIAQAHEKIQVINHYFLVR